jgi:peroxiredoxin Q/BCP
VNIVGASFNSVEKNHAWAEQQAYPFELWSDSDKTLALHFRATRTRLSPLPGRVTVLLDREGRVLLEYLEGVDVGTHPGDVLEDCRKLFGDPAPPR